MDNIVKFEYYKSQKELGSVSPTPPPPPPPPKNEKICKRFNLYC